MSLFKFFIVCAVCIGTFSNSVLEELLLRITTMEDIPAAAAQQLADQCSNKNFDFTLRPWKRKLISWFGGIQNLNSFKFTWWDQLHQVHSNRNPSMARMCSCDFSLRQLRTTLRIHLLCNSNNVVKKEITLHSNKSKNWTRELLPGRLLI